MGQLTTRQEKKRQMVRRGYGGVGVGAVLLLVALSTASWLIGLIALVVLVISGWMTRMMRSL
jgi:hypothetical protein